MAETKTIKQYHDELKTNINNSEFLLSISTLSPENWIEENVRDYVSTISKCIHNGKTVGRITLIDDKEKFEGKLIPLILEGYISHVSKYHQDGTIRNEKRKLINLPAFKILIRSLLIDTLMIFGVIHSSIEDKAFIIWRNKNNTKKKKTEIDESLEYRGKIYDELLIYSNKICCVNYDENKETVELSYFNEDQIVTEAKNKWEELKSHILDTTIIGTNVLEYLKILDSKFEKQEEREKLLSSYQIPYNNKSHGTFSKKLPSETD